MSDTQPTAAQPERNPEDHQPAEQLPPPPPPPAAPPSTTYATPPAAHRPRLRDRPFGLRALIAVGLAGVVLGGLAGFGIHAATDGEDREDRLGRFGPGGPGGFRGGQGPGQGPGQLPQPPQGAPSQGS